MDWFWNLYNTPSVGSAILFVAITIAMGLWLGRIKIGGISLGITWILFAGILLGHLGVRVEANTLHFIKEFGLILFVYAIGLQVGPSFFSSFKEGGLRLNLLAVAIVLLGVAVTYGTGVITGTDMSTMAGIYTGAITNTPGLGAAQQTYADLHGVPDETMAMGYAAAYPLGVVGIIFSTLLLRWVARINLDKEVLPQKGQEQAAMQVKVRMTNPQWADKRVSDVVHSGCQPFVIAQIRHADGSIELANSNTILQSDDVLLCETCANGKEQLVALLGEECSAVDFSSNSDSPIVSRRIAVSNAKMNGMRLGRLHLRSLYDINITRICRSGIELLATEDLQLQVGDRVSVLGTEADVQKVANLLGNEMKKLDHPNLIPIFLGIFLGIILGSIPIKFPGLPMPVKLGLAGGPLIVAILIGRFGPFYKMVTYTTTSANLMLREVGISLFLAAVGLGAGSNFVSTIVNGGYMWVFYGLAITLIPLIIVTFIGRFVMHIDYFTLIGMVAGATTDPPALAYANSLGENSQSSVAYATVYPLTMFLRILTAQILVIL
ncbi:MAG: putative transporter [Bacteroidales bacterium]|nr:putative transporter [Bacteroidales bacterium]